MPRDAAGLAELKPGDAEARSLCELTHKILLFGFSPLGKMYFLNALSLSYKVSSGQNHNFLSLQFSDGRLTLDLQRTRKRDVRNPEHKQTEVNPG